MTQSWGYVSLLLTFSSEGCLVIVKWGISQGAECIPITHPMQTKLALSTTYFVSNSNVPGIWWMISSCGVLQCVGRANAICSAIWELDSGHWRFCDGQQRCFTNWDDEDGNVRMQDADDDEGISPNQLSPQKIKGKPSRTPPKMQSLVPSENWTVVTEGSDGQQRCLSIWNGVDGNVRMQDADDD